MTDMAPEPPESVAASPVSRRSWLPVVERAVAAAGWCFLALLCWTTVAIWLGNTWPARITVLAQSIVPLLFLPVYLLGPVAWWRHRRWLAVACAVAAMLHLVLVVPAIGSTSTPSWAATAPRVTVLSANVYDGNADPAAAARSLLAQDTDVMIVVEMNEEFQQQLIAAGVDARYPYQFVGSFTDLTMNVEGIYSKTPLTHLHDLFLGHETLHAATVTVGGRPLELVSIHINSAVHSREEWVTETNELGDYARSVVTPLALVGDFNATRWNPPFADLLDNGMSDAHESRGKGLTFSWPNFGLPFAVMRLDHALLNWQVTATQLRDFEVAGSDHVGFVVELAIHR